MPDPIIISGSTTPSIAGTYAPSGTHNGQLVYVRDDSAFAYWFTNDSEWWVTPAVDSFGPSWSNTHAGAPLGQLDPESGGSGHASATSLSAVTAAQGKPQRTQRAPRKSPLRSSASSAVIPSDPAPGLAPMIYSRPLARHVARVVARRSPPRPLALSPPLVLWPAPLYAFRRPRPAANRRLPAASLPVPRARLYAEARGLYRVFAPACFWIYRKSGSPPSPSDEPWATTDALPATPADPFSDGSWYLSVSWFDGIYDSGFLPVGPAGETYLRLDIVGGQLQKTPPVGPLGWQLSLSAGGVVRVRATRYFLPDPLAPTQWAIAYTTDGSEPAADSPQLWPGLSAGSMAVLDQALPAQASGVVVKIRLQTRRNDGTADTPVWVYSELSTVQSITVATAGPSAPLGGEAIAGILETQP